MRNLVQAIAGCGCAVLFAVAAAGQPVSNRVSIPFSDPSRPGVVKVKLMYGGVTVKGYEGKEVVVEAAQRGARALESEPRNGGKLKYIETSPGGLRVEEEDNVVTVSSGPKGGAGGLELRVPYATSLKLSCVNEGAIRVEKVEGEIEANCLNGSVTLTGVSGAALAHSLNGDVQVRMTRVPPGKPMSFSTLNGDVDLTLPPDTKAEARLETQNGLIHNEFETDSERNPPGAGAGAGRKPTNPTGWEIGKSATSRLNGGGAEIHLKAFNGNIHLRKGK